VESRIEITEFTDPYCTWCWGSEPVLRHALEAYGEQISLRFVMGGLVEDRTTFYNPANGIGGEQWEQQIAAHCHQRRWWRAQENLSCERLVERVTLLFARRRPSR
jgi:protein-disulfide isomerase-like protein with CxxC motif